MKKPFSETRDTVFFDLRTPEERAGDHGTENTTIVKVALSDIGFVLGVTANQHPGVAAASCPEGA